MDEAIAIKEQETGISGCQECATPEGSQPVEEVIKVKEETKEAGRTTEALADVGTRPEVRIPAPGGASTVKVAIAPAVEEQAAPLFSPEEAKDFRGRWDAIQASFVDEPRQVVEQADNLVALTMKRLAEMFTAERAKLEGQWDHDEKVSTEDLRLALRRYRSFFGRLLTV